MITSKQDELYEPLKKTLEQCKVIPVNSATFYPADNYERSFFCEVNRINGHRELRGISIKCVTYAVICRDFWGNKLGFCDARLPQTYDKDTQEILQYVSMPSYPPTLVQSNIAPVSTRVRSNNQIHYVQNDTYTYRVYDQVENSAPCSFPWFKELFNCSRRDPNGIVGYEDIKLAALARYANREEDLNNRGLFSAAKEIMQETQKGMKKDLVIMGSDRKEYSSTSPESFKLMARTAVTYSNRNSQELGIGKLWPPVLDSNQIADLQFKVEIPYQYSVYGRNYPLETKNENAPEARDEQTEENLIERLSSLVTTITDREHVEDKQTQEQQTDKTLTTFFTKNQEQHAQEKIDEQFEQHYLEQYEDLLNNQEEQQA